MSKRAVLLDCDDEVIAHLTYAEMDHYIALGLVERLSAVKASTHTFRLLRTTQQPVVSQVFNRLEFAQTSLTASVCRANAGVADDVSEILWARRLVRQWPLVGDTLAAVRCRLARISKAEKSKKRKRRN